MRSWRKFIEIWLVVVEYTWYWPPSAHNRENRSFQSTASSFPLIVPLRNRSRWTARYPRIRPVIFGLIWRSEGNDLQLSQSNFNSRPLSSPHILCMPIFWSTRHSQFLNVFKTWLSIFFCETHDIRMSGLNIRRNNYRMVALCCHCILPACQSRCTFDPNNSGHIKIRLLGLELDSHIIDVLQATSWIWIWKY